MPVRRSCSGPPGGPRRCWRLSACPRRLSSARRSLRPRRSPGVGGLLGLAEPVSPGRVSSVPLGLPFLSVGRFMPVYLPFGSCSAARHWAPTRRVLDLQERSVDAWRKRASCQAEHGWGGRHRDAAGAGSTEAVGAVRSSGHGLPPRGDCSLSKQGWQAEWKACGRLERPSSRSVAAASPFSTPRLWVPLRVPLPASRP